MTVTNAALQGEGPPMAQSIVTYVDAAMDNAVIGPVHRRVLAIICAGLFFDVIDFIILGSLVPDMIRTHFATPAGIGMVGTATLVGLFIGTLGQGELTDRFGRKRSSSSRSRSTASPPLRPP
jgi:hypothetical protein